MKIASTAFWLPKAGHTAQEYEDACWPQEPLDLQTDLARFAVADGATETSFADIWARDLSCAYGKGWFSRGNTRHALDLLRRVWHRRIRHKTLEWYAQEKAAIGAFSSLIGLTIKHNSADSSGRWHALAVGDSCLFHIRGKTVLNCFPLERSDQFNSRPNLICSVAPTLPRPLTSFGYWESGDVFYLLTDALACWFLRGREKQTCDADRLCKLTSQEQFSRFIAEQRASRRLRNDDVTLLRVTVQKGGD
jgi:hypothetical protein